MEPELPGPVVPDPMKVYSGTAPPEWLSVWKEARSTARKGNLAEAVRNYRRLINLKPNINEAYWELARIKAAQEEFDKAADLLDELPPRYQQRLDVLIVMAQVQEQLGRLDRAAEFYGNILKSDGGNIAALSGMVRCVLANREDREALPYLERLYEASGKDRGVAGMLARLYYDLDLYRKVIPVIRPLVDSGDVSVESLLLIARSEDRLGNRERALTYWRRILTLDEQNREAHRYLADYYEDEQNWSAALEHLRGLGQVLPADKKPFLRIARCYVKLHKPGKALESLNAYLDHWPYDKEALRFLVNVNASLGREDKTLAALDRYFAVESKPPAEKLKQAARLYDAQGRYREAIPLYKKLIRNNPDDSGLLKTLAEDLLAIGEDEGALHILNQLAAISPERETYQAMADLLEKLDRRDELILVLERLHIKDPANPETVLRLISLYLETNEIKRAEDLYREIAGKLLASPLLLKKRGRFAIIFGMQEHGLRDYAKFLEMEYDREICFDCIKISGRLGLVTELKRYTALFIKESFGVGTGRRQTVEKDILEDRFFREIGAVDYLTLAKAWRQAFLLDTSRAMYRVIIDKPGASGTIRFQAFCGLAEISHREGLPYETEEAYRMAMAIADNQYHIIGRLVETYIENGKYRKATAWLSLMDRVEQGDVPKGLCNQFPDYNRALTAPLDRDHRVSVASGENSGRGYGGKWYRDFLFVKMSMARGFFRDAVSRGEALARKIDRKSDYGSRGAGENDDGNRQLIGRLKKLLAAAYISLHEYEQAEQIITELEAMATSSLLPDTLRLMAARERGQGEDRIFDALLAETGHDIGLVKGLHHTLVTLKESGMDRLRDEYADRVRRSLLDKNREDLEAAILSCRADMAQREYEDALSLCRDFLSRFPGNTTLESLAAELYSRLHRYDQALFYCDRVLAANSQRADILLLKARIIWRSDREKSLSIIQGYLQEPTTEDLIRSAAARQGVALPPQPDKSFWETYKEKIIRQENGRKSYLDTIMEPDFLIGSERDDVFAVVYRYYARYRWQQLFREEAAARRAVVRGQYFRAAHHLTNLLAYQEYSDISLLFDLALVYDNLGRFEDEAYLYRQVKKYDARFPGLDKQIRRNRLQLRPRFALTYKYRQEEGRDGYKAMKRSEGGVSSRFIFNPKEDLRFSAAHIRYDSTAGDGDPLSAKRLFLSSRGSLMNQATFKLGAGVEFLNHDNSRTGLFLCQVGRKFADDISVSFSFERDIVADTYASLTRNVVSDNSRAAITWDISPFFSAGGNYGLINYSDSNDLDEYSFWTKCHIFGKPSYLTFTYQYSFRDAEESQVGTGAVLADGFHADDHPYWAPQDYWENSFSLNWKQPISILLREHESPSYYSASYSLDYDERGQVSQTVEGGVYLEWGHHLIGRSSVRYTASENYDVREFSLAAIYRW